MRTLPEVPLLDHAALSEFLARRFGGASKTLRSPPIAELKTPGRPSVSRAIRSNDASRLSATDVDSVTSTAIVKRFSISSVIAEPQYPTVSPTDTGSLREFSKGSMPRRLHRRQRDQRFAAADATHAGSTKSSPITIPPRTPFPMPTPSCPKQHDCSYPYKESAVHR